jgi:hypothetical protein
MAIIKLEPPRKRRQRLDLGRVAGLVVSALLDAKDHTIDWRMLDEKLLDSGAPPLLIEKACLELQRVGFTRTTVVNGNFSLQLTRWGIEKVGKASPADIAEYLAGIQEMVDDGDIRHEINSKPFRGGAARPIR